MKRRTGMMAATAVAALLGIGIGLGQGLTMGGDLNPACISMRIVYDICWTTSIPPVPYPCAHLRFWQPKWTVETRADYANLGAGRHFHFHDAKVKPVTQGFAFNDPCRSCIVPTLNAIVPYFYHSKEDPGWHREQSTSRMPLAIDAMRVGWWGRNYPRVGYVTHTSPVSSSGLAATRAFNIARSPFDLWPNPGNLRNLYAPLIPNAVGIALPCMNLEDPARCPCHRAGFDMRNVFDRAAPDGRYKWVIWKPRRCTLPLPLQWCAEVLNGLPKANRCF